MVARVLVGGFHAFLAVTYALDGVLCVLQGVVNLQWEQHFYGEAAFGTLIMLFAGLFLMCLSLLGGAIGVAFAAGIRPANHAMLALSLFYAFIAPWPAQGLMFIAVAVAFVQLLPDPATIAEQTDDDDY